MSGMLLKVLRESPSGAEARLDLALVMCGLKPVPFRLNPLPFTDGRPFAMAGSL